MLRGPARRRPPRRAGNGHERRFRQTVHTLRPTSTGARRRHHRPGAEGRGAPFERDTADDPRRQRRNSRPRIPGTAACCRLAAGAGHHELGSARRAYREVGARGADGHVKLNHTARNEADAVLVLGSRLGETDWWGKPPYWRAPAEQATIQVDIDGAILGANRPVALAVQADTGCFSTRSRSVLESCPCDRDERVAQVAEVPRKGRDRAGEARRETPGHRGADEPGTHRARVPAGCSRRAPCWWSTVATR